MTTTSYSSNIHKVSRYSNETQHKLSHKQGVGAAKERLLATTPPPKAKISDPKDVYSHTHSNSLSSHNQLHIATLHLSLQLAQARLRDASICLFYSMRPFQPRGPSSAARLQLINKVLTTSPSSFFTTYFAQEGHEGKG